MWDVEVSGVDLTRGREGKRATRKVVRHLWPAGGDAEQFKAPFRLGAVGPCPFPFVEGYFAAIIITATVY